MPSYYKDPALMCTIEDSSIFMIILEMILTMSH